MSVTPTWYLVLAAALFSVGAVGLMVRDGEFAEPVREATIA